MTTTETLWQHLLIFSSVAIALMLAGWIVCRSIKWYLRTKRGRYGLIVLLLALATGMGWAIYVLAKYKELYFFYISIAAFILINMPLLFMVRFIIAQRRERKQISDTPRQDYRPRILGCFILWLILLFFSACFIMGAIIYAI
jgi:hypothetical protein